MGLKTFRSIYQESHKYNLYFALIFEKEELDHVQVYTDNITVSTIFYPFKIQNLINGQCLLVPVIKPIMLKLPCIELT